MTAVENQPGPGISLQQSDVFETSDLPESDQYYFPVEESDVIETVDVTTNQAFSRFQGSVVDNSKVDFSDTIRNCRRKGYIVWRGESKENEEETPVKKYQRLNCEIRELLDEIKEAKSTGSSDLESSSLHNLAGQVEVLHKCLLELRMEDVVGVEALNSMTNPQVAIRDQLTNEINQIQMMKVSQRNLDDVNTAQASTNQAKQSPQQLQYSLLMKPERMKLQNSSELTSLVDRITAIESCLQENKEDMDNIRMDTGKKTLSEAISVLSSKSTILEPRNLDHIEGRLALLIQRIKDDENSDSSSTAEENESTMQNIQHLDKLMNKSNIMLQEVPDVIDRLEALNPLHTQASQLNQAILQLEITQKQLVSQTGNNSTLLKEVESRLQQNIASISNNFDKLQHRIDAVKEANKQPKK